MSKEVLKKIKTLKDKMNASSQSEVIRNAITLLTAVEEARNIRGKIIISNRGNMFEHKIEIDLPWK